MWGPEGTLEKLKTHARNATEQRRETLLLGVEGSLKKLDGGELENGETSKTESQN